MLKPLGVAIRRRERAYITTFFQTQEASKLITQFCIENLGVGGKDIIVRCIFKEGVLTIQTKSKVFSQELTLRLPELVSFLQSHDVETSEIHIW